MAKNRANAPARRRPFRFFYKLHIKDKLIVTLIPIMLVTYVIFASSIAISFRETKQLVDNQTRIVANQKTQLVDSYLQQFRTETEVFMFDPAFQKAFKVSKSELSLDEQDKLTTEIRQFMYSMIINYDVNVESIALVNRNDDYYYWRMDSRISHYSQKSRLSALTMATTELDGGMYYSYDKLDEGIVTVSRVIRDISFNTVLGLMMVDFNLNFLHSVTSVQTSNLGTTAVQLAVATQSGTEVYNSTQLSYETLSENEDTSRSLTQDGVQYKVNRTASERNDWILYTVVNETELYRTIHQAVSTQVFLMLFSIVLVFLAIYKVSRTISGQFGHFMQQVSRTTAPDTHALIQVDSEDEFRDLARVYNEMILRINHLIDTVYAKELLQRSAELKAFQAQINPHFLYNTLDCINGLVELNRPDDIRKTVTALASIMRMSIKGRDLLTVRENLFYVEQYMFIERLRYPDKLVYLCEIPENMLGCYMPKLVLQPILENSVIHGISENLGRGMIGLFGHEDGDDLIFTVKDNGRGFPEAILATLQHDTADTDDAMMTRESIGLMNIQKRLQLLYGARYGLTAENMPGGGSCVTIRLPKITRDTPEGGDTK